MSVFSKICIAALAAAVPGALAEDLTIKEGQVQRDGKDLTVESVADMKEGTVLSKATKGVQEVQEWKHVRKTLQQQPGLVEVNGELKVASGHDFVVSESKAKLTLTSKDDAKDVFTVERVDATTKTWGKAKDANLKDAEDSVFGADSKFEELFTSEVAEKKYGKITYTVVRSDAATPASVTMILKDPEFTLEITQGEANDAEWKSTDEKFVYEATNADKESALKKGKEISIKQGEAENKFNLTKDAECKDKKCTLTLQSQTSQTTEFTADDGKKFLSGSEGDNVRHEVVVSEKEPMMWASEKQESKNDADMLDYMKGAQEGVETWSLKSPAASSMLLWWIIGGSAVLVIAVICFFVFGGKKNTESDDESDLDTSDDEEEDAAATEAKEEEA